MKIKGKVVASDLNERQGMIVFPNNILRARPESVAETLAFLKFLPSSVEVQVNTTIFIGFSHKFDKTLQGQPIPFYSIKVQTKGRILVIKEQYPERKKTPKKNGKKETIH